MRSISLLFLVVLLSPISACSNGARKSSSGDAGWIIEDISFEGGIAESGSQSRMDAGLDVSIGTDTAGGEAGGQGSPVDAGNVVDLGTLEADSDAGSQTKARDWSKVEALLVSSAAGAGVADIGLSIWDANDARVFERMLGALTPDTRMAVASASKMVSGLVLFDVIAHGRLTLDSTTGQVLGWTGTNATITLRQLLSFTSGLAPEAACTLNPLTTLAACVDTIRDSDVLAAPGTRFDYGSTHLHVAARMAEVATGMSWADLFTEAIATPLGLGNELIYYTFPKQALGKINPLIAGGLRTTVNEYADILGLVFHRGSFRGLTVGTPALFDEQNREPYPHAVIGNTPIGALGLPYHYGLTAWLMCATPSTGCDELSSPGAFGFTPWLDRQAGYYAILSMELDRNETDSGVVDFAVSLQQALEPLIREQL